MKQSKKNLSLVNIAINVSVRMTKLIFKIAKIVALFVSKIIRLPSASISSKLYMDIHIKSDNSITSEVLKFTLNLTIQLVSFDTL